MSRRMKTKQSAMKLSQIRRRIELCLREIILRFEMNLQNLLFSWQFNSYSYFKAITEVLKLVFHPVVRGTTSGLRAKMGQVVRCTQVESTFFGGRKQDAEHAAWKLAGQFFATTWLRQFAR
jgi:hypothetical protein